MRDKTPRETFILGTAVNITAILSIDTATAVTITIKDPSLSVVVNSASMTKQVNKVYNYVYQSSSTGTSGIYTIRIEATYGGYTTIWEDNFIMRTQA